MMGALGAALAIAAWALITARTYFLLKGHIAIGVFNQVVLRLCKADTLDRAIKLSSSVPSSPYAVSVHAALKALSVSSRRDAITAQSDMTMAFDEAYARARIGLQRTAFLPWLALALFVGALALPVKTWVYIAIAMGALAALRAILQTKRQAAGPGQFYALAAEIAKTPAALAKSSAVR